MSTDTDPYNLDPSFEAVVAAYTATSPDFYASVGHALEPNALSRREAMLVVSAAHAHRARTGSSPTDIRTVLQELARQRHEGEVTDEDRLDVDDYLSDVIDEGLPPLEEAIGSLAPVLKDRMQDEGIRMAMDAHSARADMAEVIEHLRKASSLGTRKRATGTKLGEASFAKLAHLRNLERLSTGIMDLDLELRGGVARGTLNVALGGTGSGKSMLLTQVAAAGAMHGLHVAAATLELPEPYWFARLKANLTGVPTVDIETGAQDDLVRERLGELDLGPVYVGEFTAGATTVEETTQWLDELEQREGRPVDLFVTDYADKFGHGAGREYEGMLHVYEGLRIQAVERNMWAWTASQAKRKDKRAKNTRLDTEDGADSQHKARVADLWITLNAMEEGELIEFYIAKNRLGKGRIAVGPLPTEFECARIAPINYSGEFEDGLGF